MGIELALCTHHEVQSPMQSSLYYVSLLWMADAHQSGFTQLQIHVHCMRVKITRLQRRASLLGQ